MGSSSSVTSSSGSSTGAQAAAQDVRGDTSDRPQSLQSNMPGVFAVGDVRAGSVKRVGAAIGEGAQVVAALHAYLTTE